MKRCVAFGLALTLLLSLCACGAQPPAEPVPAPSQSAPAPESGPDPAPETVSEPAVLAAAPGVGYQVILPAGSGSIRRGATVWDGCLLVEVDGQRPGGRDLLALDLETGEQVFSRSMDGYRDALYQFRPSLTAPGEFSIVTQEGCRRFDRSGLLGEYTLPEAARAKEDYPFYGHLIRWDVLPDRDLLVWSDPEGIWLSDTGGGAPRLVLATGEITRQPAFSHLAEAYGECQPEEKFTFLSVRLMNGGRTLAANFGTPRSQSGTLGLAVLDLSGGKADWYDVYDASFGGSGMECLDDTTLQAGLVQIDVTTGESRPLAKGTLTDRFYAITGDFSHYYGVEETETEYRLVACTMENWQTAEPVLTLPRHQESFHREDGACTAFYPFEAAGERVVCLYSLSGGEGLLLVTVTEAGPSYLTPGQGVTCKEVLSWPARRGEWTEAVFAPRDGLVLVRATQRDERLRPARGQLMGVDMKLGEVAFTMPLTAENDVRKVPEDPGGDSVRFVLADSAGYTRYIWGKGRGVHEQWSFTLPPAIAQAVADWAAVDPAGQRFQDDWDARWMDDIVTWVTGEGVWVAGGDGNDARLAVSMAEIYRRPRYQEYLELKRRQADAQLEDCLHLGRPRLMNGGNTLVVPIDNRVSLYIPDDLLVIDLATGERTWHEGVRGTGKGGTGLEIVDDTTILAGETTLIHLADGSTREVSRQPGRFVVTVDEKGGTAIYPRDLPSGTFLLAPRGDCRIDRILAEEGDRVLLTCITGEAAGNATTRLVLATLPDKEQ